MGRNLQYAQNSRQIWFEKWELLAWNHHSWLKMSVFFLSIDPLIHYPAYWRLNGRNRKVHCLAGREKIPRNPSIGDWSGHHQFNRSLSNIWSIIDFRYNSPHSFHFDINYMVLNWNENFIFSTFNVIAITWLDPNFRIL